MDTSVKTAWIAVAGGIIVALITASVTLLDNSSGEPAASTTTTINQTLEPGATATTHTGSGDINLSLPATQKKAE